ncbi:MAG: hypothetical protein K1000chlam2_00424 [Chlamydiae bacterium]|nr:hypothetical protein [Chlamydiota bacterium]
MSLPIKRKEFEDPPVQNLIKKPKSEPPLGLSEEIWQKIFHCLIPQNAFGSLRESSSYFRDLTLPAIHSYLAEKTILTAKEILQLRLPLLQLLIYHAKPFQKCKEDQEREVKGFWKDFSIPELCSYILFRCTQLKTLDLRHDRYGVLTFLGKITPFYPYEVATQSVDDYVNPMETTGIIEPMRDVFNKTYLISKQLLQLQTLIIPFKKSVWKECHLCFPHLHQIEICKEKIALGELKEALVSFPTIKTCVLRGCKLIIQEIPDFFLKESCPDIFVDGGEIHAEQTKYSLKDQNRLTFCS